MTPALGAFAIAYLLVVLVALGYRRRAAQWEAKANQWFARAVKAEAGPSVSKDVARLREWRKHQALRSSDHTTLHHFPADSDRETVGHLLRASGGKVQ